MEEKRPSGVDVSLVWPKLAVLPGMDTTAVFPAGISAITCQSWGLVAWRSLLPARDRIRYAAQQSGVVVVPETVPVMYGPQLPFSALVGQVGVGPRRHPGEPGSEQPGLGSLALGSLARSSLAGKVTGAPWHAAKATATVRTMAATIKV